MPTPAEADLPRLHREVEALRLRNQLDPKRFYRKEEGEGKGTKGLPKYFAVCLLSRHKTSEIDYSLRSVQLLPRILRLMVQVQTIFPRANANGHWWMNSSMTQKRNDTQRKSSASYNPLEVPRGKIPSRQSRLFENPSGDHLQGSLKPSACDLLSTCYPT